MQAEKSRAIAEDAQRDLDEALPALEAALTSLKSLNKNDVIEVCSSGFKCYKRMFFMHINTIRIRMDGFYVLASMPDIAGGRQRWSFNVDWSPRLR